MYQIISFNINDVFRKAIFIPITTSLKYLVLIQLEIWIFNAIEFRFDINFKEEILS